MSSGRPGGGGAVGGVRTPWGALALIVASCLITIAVAALGPSAVTLDVGPARSPLPPWSLRGAAPAEWVVVPALWLGILLGGVGLWRAERALRRGWSPRPGRLVGLGAALSVATACVPPLTSADTLMYAAYGRLAKLGLDPYVVTPAQVIRTRFDPVLALTERPWQDTPSVYGPVVMGTQWLANVLGGDTLHGVVFWLQAFGVGAFVAVGVLAVWLTRGDRARQARAALLTIANPLLIWAVVAGGHNEALTLLPAVAALACVRRHPFVAGLFLGLAGAGKVSLVFYGLAILWAYRREPGRVLRLGLGAVLPLAVGYGVLAPGALLAAGRNAGYISQGSWGLPVVFVLEFALGDELARSVVTKLGWVLMVALAWLLARVLPWDAVPGWASGGAGGRPDRLTAADGRADPLTVAARTTVVLAGAWVLASPYSLAWYDLIVWVPLALLAAGPLDRLLIVRGTALSVAYVTARAIEFSPTMATASWFVREIACSAVQIGVLVALVAWAWRSGRSSARDAAQPGGDERTVAS